MVCIHMYVPVSGSVFLFVCAGERDKKRMKATRILSTPHNVPAEEEVGRAGGDAGAARSPARSPAMEEVDDPE
jgi:hypothetical protein